MGVAEEEREPLVAPTVPDGLPKAQPTGHIAMAVPDLGRASQRSWDGSLMACCGHCDAEGVSTFAYVKYCTPFAWGHNMKRAFNASFWKHAILFALLFGAWWWLYVGFATQAGLACGPPPPPFDRPLPAEEPWRPNPLPAEPFKGGKVSAKDQTFLTGATWQPEKFKPEKSQEQQQPGSTEPVPLDLIDVSEPVEDVKKPESVTAGAEQKTDEAAAAAKKQAEEAAAAAKQQAEEAAAAAQKQAEELAQQAEQAAADAQDQSAQQAQQAQDVANQLAKQAQEQSKQALETIQEQFNHNLELTPGKEQLETQLQLAKKVVADGMAAINAQLEVSGRKLLHKHDDDDDHDDKNHHKDKKEKKEKKQKKGKGKHKDKHDKESRHEHPDPDGHPEFGPESPACKAAQNSMVVMWLIALVSALIGVRYAAIMRTAIRERYGIQGTRMKDCLAWLFCAPCALCQETRTLHMNNVHSGVWFGPTMLGAPAHPLQAPPQQAVNEKPLKNEEEAVAKV